MTTSSGEKALLDSAKGDSISYFTCAHAGQMGVCEGCLDKFTNEAVSTAVRDTYQKVLNAIDGPCRCPFDGNEHESYCIRKAFVDIRALAEEPPR